MWVPFLRSFPGPEAHIIFGERGSKMGVLGGIKKFLLKMFIAFSVP